MDKFEKITEKIDDFAVEHPTAYLALFCLGGFAVTIPLCVMVTKFTGKVYGKEMAKELAKAGVSLGYTHD